MPVVIGVQYDESHVFLGFCEQLFLFPNLDLFVEHLNHFQVGREMVEQGDAVEDLVELGQLRVQADLLRVFAIVGNVLPEFDVHASNRELQNIGLVNLEITRGILVDFTLLVEFL